MMIDKSNLIKVDSRMLELIGYEESKLEFYAKFPRSKDLYIYPNISKYKYEKVLRGEKADKNGKYPSIGAAFIYYIKILVGEDLQKLQIFSNSVS